MRMFRHAACPALKQACCVDSCWDLLSYKLSMCMLQHVCLQDASACCVPSLVCWLAKLPASQSGLYCRLVYMASGMWDCQKRICALPLSHLGTHERQVNPLTAYAMMSVLDIPKGEWLAQARTSPETKPGQE